MTPNERTLEQLFEIDESGEGLSRWELDFVADLVDRGVMLFSPAQREKVEQIYERRVGRG